MTKVEMRKQIETEVEEVYKKVETIYQKSFPRIPVEFGLTGKVAGYFCCKGVSGKVTSAKLKFNLGMAVDNEDEFKSTIPHEIAHYVVRLEHGKVKPHGNIWKNVMLELGENPKRTHNYKVTAENHKRTPYRYTCKCGKDFYVSRIKHLRVQKKNTTYCKNCKHSLQFVGHINDVGLKSEVTVVQLDKPIKQIVKGKGVKPPPVIPYKPPPTTPPKLIEEKTFPTTGELTPRANKGKVQPVKTVVSIAEARKKGYSLYYSGPCKYGHISVKYAANGSCKKCDQLHRKDKSHKIDSDPRPKP